MLPRSLLSSAPWQPGLVRADSPDDVDSADKPAADVGRVAVTEHVQRGSSVAAAGSGTIENALLIGQQRSLARSVLDRTPLTLAATIGRSEQAAEPGTSEERSPELAAMTSSRIADPSGAPAMPLARSAAATAAQAVTAMASMSPFVQREEAPAPAAPPPAETAPTDTGKYTSEVAEKVFALLQRRLVIERERSGFRRM
jgi:hypothetical protein